MIYIYNYYNYQSFGCGDYEEQQCCLITEFNLEKMKKLVEQFLEELSLDFHANLFSFFEYVAKINGIYSSRALSVDPTDHNLDNVAFFDINGFGDFITSDSPILPILVERNKKWEQLQKEIERKRLIELQDYKQQQDYQLFLKLKEQFES